MPDTALELSFQQPPASDALARVCLLPLRRRRSVGEDLPPPAEETGRGAARGGKFPSSRNLAIQPA